MARVTDDLEDFDEFTDFIPPPIERGTGIPDLVASKRTPAAKALVEEAFPALTTRTVAIPGSFVVSDAEEMVALISEAMADEEEITEIERMFLKGYMDAGTITAGLRRSGMTRNKYLQLMSKKPAFARAVEHAHDSIVDSLTTEAFKRALTGSDKLLIKMLESLNPQRFARRTYTDAKLEANVNVNTWGELAARAEVIDAEVVPISIPVLEEGSSDAD